MSSAHYLPYHSSKILHEGCIWALKGIFQMNFLKKLHHPFFDHSLYFWKKAEIKLLGLGASSPFIFLAAEDTSSSSNILSRKMAQC